MKKILGIILLSVSSITFAQSTFTSLDVISLIVQGIRFSMTESVPKEMTVVSRGVGKTQEEAINSALNISVQKAIGVLIVSEQTVQNDKLIRDITAQYSSGVVTGYKINHCDKIASGLISCDIVANVSPWKFMRKLEGDSRTIKVNGKDLSAQFETSKTTLIQREKITKYYMSQIRQSGLEVLVKEVKLIPSVSDNATLMIDYEVKWNPDFKKEMIRFLQKLEKDTAGSNAGQVYIQWAPTGLFENRVYINTHNENYRAMMMQYMTQPVMIRFNELNMCEDVAIDHDVFAIDWYGVKRKKTITVHPDKLKNLQTISLSIGCTT